MFKKRFVRTKDLFSICSHNCLNFDILINICKPFNKTLWEYFLVILYQLIESLWQNNNEFHDDFVILGSEFKMDGWGICTSWWLGIIKNLL